MGYFFGSANSPSSSTFLITDEFSVISSDFKGKNNIKINLKKLLFLKIYA